MEEIADPLETVAAEFTAFAAGHLPTDISTLPFASVISARSPDIYLLWHPVYRRKHKAGLLAYHLALMLYKKIRGCQALFSLREQFRYKIYGEVGSTLLVTPALCGKETGGNWQTNYVKISPKDALFVFGFGEQWGKDAHAAQALSVGKAYAYAWALAITGIRAAFSIKGTLADRILVLLLWLTWVVSFEWFESYYFKQTLEKAIKEHRLQKIGCIHEMHGYARLIWILGQQYHLSTHALQHASVTEGKRWYFADKAERKAGLQLPQRMYVYDRSVIDLLRPYFPSTEFKLGLSWRYAHWKDVAPAATRGEHVLFVSALAGFDNTVLINVLKRLHSEGVLKQVHLRFHPLARLTPLQRQWIKARTDNGWIVLTGQVPLKEDLARARVVVGMGTTVLEEALLLGCPVVHLQHLDYVQYIHLDGVRGASLKAWDQITGRYLEDIPLSSDVTDIRHRFGLEHHLVDYVKLFQ